MKKCNFEKLSGRLTEVRLQSQFLTKKNNTFADDDPDTSQQTAVDENIHVKTSACACCRSLCLLHLSTFLRRNVTQAKQQTLLAKVGVEYHDGWGYDHTKRETSVLSQWGI